MQKEQDTRFLFASAVDSMTKTGTAENTLLKSIF